MKRTVIGARLLAAAACLSVPTVALAQECVRGDSSITYCKCLYDEALDRIMSRQGSSRASMKQRLEALKSALEKCFKGSSEELETEIQKI